MILVTGATGTVGAELVKRLSERGTPARALFAIERKRTPLHTLELRSSRAISRTGNIRPHRLKSNSAASSMRPSAAACATS
jgi:nucleoside-diphosphate-sugar epimerase